MSNLEVRFAFVEMLFALSIAEVAIAFSHLISIDRDLYLKAPAIAHLLLATLLIATSWLGWSTSRWRTGKTDLNSPFSLGFVGLLLDVLIVVIYFILVRLVDISEKEPYELPVPSAVPEAWCIVWVFIVYAVWDFASDVINEPTIGWRIKRWFKPDGIRLSLACMACSLLCLCMTWLVHWRAEQFAPPGPFWASAEDAHAGLRVVWLDCALACVVLLFRALKFHGEAWIWRNVPAIHKFEAYQEERKVEHHEGAWTFWSMLGFGLFLALGW